MDTLTGYTPADAATATADAADEILAHGSIALGTIARELDALTGHLNPGHPDLTALRALAGACKALRAKFDATTVTHPQDGDTLS